MKILFDVDRVSVDGACPSSDDTRARCAAMLLRASCNVRGGVPSCDAKDGRGVRGYLLIFLCCDHNNLFLPPLEAASIAAVISSSAARLACVTASLNARRVCTCDAAAAAST